MKSINDRIESIEVVPMNKESIFDEPYSENETHAITRSFDEWISEMQRLNESDFYPNNVILDGDLIEFIKDNAKAYMLAPIGKDGADCIITAKSQTFENISDIKERIDWKNSYIYMITKRRTHVHFDNSNMNDFIKLGEADPEGLDFETVYHIRYGSVE